MIVHLCKDTCLKTVYTFGNERKKGWDIMVTGMKEEVKKEILALQEEYAQLEDTPADFFTNAPYLYQSNNGKMFAAIIEENSVLFTKDEPSWGNKMIRFTKSQSEAAILQLKLEKEGKLDKESVDMMNPLNTILLSTGETLFLASVLQTALEKWRSPKSVLNL